MLTNNKRGRALAVEIERVIALSQKKKKCASSMSQLSDNL